jgi:hypothetical protein
VVASKTPAVAEAAHRRPFGPRSPAALHPPTLLIDRDRERRIRWSRRVQRIDELSQLSGRLDVPREQHDPADPPLRNPSREVIRHPNSLEAGEQELPGLIRRMHPDTLPEPLHPSSPFHLPARPVASQTTVQHDQIRAGRGSAIPLRGIYARFARWRGCSRSRIRRRRCKGERGRIRCCAGCCERSRGRGADRPATAPCRCPPRRRPRSPACRRGRSAPAPGP